jgi:phosphoglycerate dehydrogenase-like enzyme
VTSDPTAPWTLLALPPLDPSLLAGLFAGLPIQVVVPAERTPDAARAAAAEAHLVLGDWSGATGVSAELVAAAPNLVFVQQPSVGVDTIDLEACTAAGIPVANAGDTNAVSVAEWCVGSTFTVLRSMHFGDTEVRAGNWPQLELANRGGGEVTGRRVGIIGMGTIGRECASRYVALGCDVAHWSRTQREPVQAGGCRWMELDDLLRHSEVLVVVIALSSSTRGMIGAAQLAMMPAGSFVINAARGGIVDEPALVAAIESGHIAGGALDVFATEPLPAQSALRAVDRLLLSPHSAGATRQAQGRLIGHVVANIGRAVSGEPVTSVVNGLGPLIRRREA